MNKAHLISVATALSLGYAAGFATDNLAAATTVPHEIKTAQTKVLPIGNPVVQDLLTKAEAALCDDAEAALGLAADDCTTANVQSIGVNFGETEATVRVLFRFGGSLTLSAPQ